MTLHSATWFPVGHSFIRSSWSSKVISLSGMIVEYIPGLVYCWGIYICSLNVSHCCWKAVSSQRDPFSEALHQPDSHLHISPGESSTPVKARVMVLKPSLTLEFPPWKLKILTHFSKTHHTIKIFSLKILYSEVE